jgi:hypothetical protein
MNVKGTVYTTTKATVIEAFGEQRWNSFMAKLAQKEEYFKNNVIMSVTAIPLEKITIFFSEMTQEFFNNDKNSYEMFGMVGAKFALSPGGPYSSYLLTKDIKQFAEVVLPKLWTTYYDDGAAKAWVENNAVHVIITGLPIKNLYYEKLLMGYFKQAIKIFGRKSSGTALRSLTSGDKDIYFKFELKDS